MLGLQVLSLLAARAWAVADDPVEELPPPKSESSVLVKPQHAASESQQPGWGLVGPSGRHYFVGSEALADYLRGGQRHIVALEKEDPARHASPDPNYLYYRETLAGHRWAIGRQPGVDRRSSVYFQEVGAPGAWSLFERPGERPNPDSRGLLGSRN
jgi:hypothetical protein